MFIFLIAIYYWILDDIVKLKKLLLIIFFTIVILISDSLFQFLNYKTETGYGKDIFGFQSFTYGRMTGPFNDEIIGSYIAKFFFISLMISLFIDFGKYKKYIFILFFNLSFVCIFLSGERMALATLMLGILLLLFTIKYRKIVLVNTISSILIILFMIVRYRIFGLIADFAIIFNIILLISLLSLIEATLTMPGIAGIVLTVGMAVDANVLVFERIKEELKSGRSIINSIDLGYKFALKTILDANFTTLIAALLLYNYGSGPIKGFAVTLSIGIITSMFTALILTKLIVTLWVVKLKPNRLFLTKAS